MVKLLTALRALKQAKVLVLGDFMLDTYTTGRVVRISPEAPVPVLHVEKKEKLPGGAGNVALNLQALGAQVIAVGRIGNDAEGLRLKKLLTKKKSINTQFFIQKQIRTPLKNRLIS